MNRFDPYAGLRNGFPPPQEDVHGQVDGDVLPGPSPFSSSMSGAPWQAEKPPWHLWGNTQTIQIVSGGLGAVDAISGQTVKVNYKRPETWHWLFMVRVQSLTPLPTAAQIAGFQVDFDLTVGIGRSAVSMPSFEVLLANWDAATPVIYVPINFPKYSTSVLGPARRTGPDGPLEAEPENRIDQIVAQDIQLTPRIQGTSEYVNTMVLDVSAYFAPKTHIRPDWLQLDKPREAMFAGDETAGT